MCWGGGVGSVMYFRIFRRNTTRVRERERRVVNVKGFVI